jgi:hypothetical protein
MTITIATSTPLTGQAADFSGLTEVTGHPGAEALQISSVSGGTIVLGAPTATPHGTWAPLWWLWTAAGARPGVILGDAGVGKTELLNGMLAATGGNPTIERWLLDPAGHSGDLTGRAEQTAVGGVEVVLDALQRLDEIATERLQFRRARQAPAPRGFLPTLPYRPTSAEPLLQVAIEGTALLLAGDGHTARLATNILARLLETGPATGIALTLLTQHAGPFLNDEWRRAVIERAMTGNTAVLRAKRRSAAWEGLDWLPGDPIDLPAELPGVGYLAGHPGPFRAFAPVASR